ncbi:hypothetical protein DAPPUDRAFT_332588 [Daphnia pulex]|uniref:Retroviral polymerase SH3-like domain-containing protein n=1 Tax=Daphnia pulex TaxID=6669 RepID=E9HQD0_DAPPU|nr:hypothetical protein DAPPUDRAFT_332588 [Daphnia pulex]|eukprot:EFX66051.1 hypothetical protein DAPPUDRAFT_332588 [Daphnia pulex]
MDVVVADVQMGIRTPTDGFEGSRIVLTPFGWIVVGIVPSCLSQGSIHRQKSFETNPDVKSVVPKEDARALNIRHQSSNWPTAIPEPEYNALTVTQTAPLTSWHERLGHVAVKTVHTMATRNLVDGLNLDDTSITTAYYHIPKELRQKLDSKCKEGIVVGIICDTTKAFRIWDPEEKKMTTEEKKTDVPHSISRDISTFEKFKENMLQEEMFPQIDSYYLQKRKRLTHAHDQHIVN